MLLLAPGDCRRRRVNHRLDTQISILWIPLAVVIVVIVVVVVVAVIVIVVIIVAVAVAFVVDEVDCEW